MKKYTVYSDHTGIQEREQRDYTTDEIINKYTNQSDYATSEIFSSESLEEAKAFFEQQKETCSTCYIKNFHSRGWTLDTDVIYLSEEEYDEDEEFIGCDELYLDIYAEPITVYRDEEDEEDDEEDEE